MGVLIAEFINPLKPTSPTAIDDPSFMSRRLYAAIFTALFTGGAADALARPDNKAASGSSKTWASSTKDFALGIEGKWDGLIFGMLEMSAVI